MKNVRDRIKKIKGHVTETGPESQDWGSIIPVDGSVRAPRSFPVKLDFSTSYTALTYPASFPEGIPADEHEPDTVGYWINYVADKGSLPMWDMRFYEWAAKEYVGEDTGVAITDGDYAITMEMPEGAVFAVVEIADSKEAIIHGWFTQQMYEEARTDIVDGRFQFPMDKLEKESR